MGESAGGGSIYHQITAFGGQPDRKHVPFQKAIIQSPGVIPVTTPEEQELYTQQFLKTAGVKSIQEARQLSSAALIRANDEVVATGVFGKFVFGT